MKKIFASSLIIISVFSCKKETTNYGVPNTHYEQTPTFYMSNYIDSSGNTHNSNGSYYTSPMTNSITVEANGTSLTYINGIYSYEQSTPVGGSSWIINKYAFSGGFSYISPKGVPYIQPLKFTSINLNQDYIYTNTINADTIIYSISNGSNSLTKKVLVSSSSITFTKQELSAIFNNSSLIAIIDVKAINVSSYTPLNTKYNFVSETVFHNGNIPIIH